MKKVMIAIVGILAISGFAGAATLNVNAGAALEGSYGLEVIFNGTTTSAYVVDTTPTNETTYRAVFLIDLQPGAPDEFTFQYAFPQPTQALRQAAQHMMFSVKDLDAPAGSQRQHVSVLLKKFDDGTAYGRYKVWTRCYDPDNPIAAGDGFVYKNNANEAMEVNLPKTAGGFPVIVLFEWQAETSPGANNGMFSLSRATAFNPALFEGKSMNTLSNSTSNVDQVELGAPSGVDAGSAGSYNMDSFESYRTLAP